MPKQVEIHPTEPASSILAIKLRSLRRKHKFTLQQLSELSGISASALSKIENGQLSPTYEKIAALANCFGGDVSEFFNSTTRSTPGGRRSVTKRGSGVVHTADQYIYEVLNSDISNKRFVPLVTTIKAHSISDFPALLQHDGEEFIYVLTGTVTVHTEFYEPMDLTEGDACYFDSSMGHACVSSGPSDAKVLWVCSNPAIPKTVG
jgi:transcriptional regulator with XRE-family HTH domain